MLSASYLQIRKFFGSKGDVLVWNLWQSISCPEHYLRYFSLYLQKRLCPASVCNRIFVFFLML